MPLKPLRFHPEAAVEYTEAFAWFAERSERAAARFEAEIERVLGQIRASPRSWRATHGPIRRFLIRRFPYAIYYFEAEIQITILAIAHGKRRDGYWASRT